MAPPCEGMTSFKYEVPKTRTATHKLEPVEMCIYCRKPSAEAVLTDEHTIPDGLGGDLVLPAASCERCAAKTSRIETHFLREVLQFQRAILGIHSRKRKARKHVIKVVRSDEKSGQEIELPIDENVPFVFPFMTTDGIAGLLRGARPDEETMLRVSLFGPQDWNEQGKKWLGGTGSYRWGHRMHPGIIGQALAKIAHAYACARLGVGGFTPFLAGYIVDREPPFDGYHISCHSSEGLQEPLHYIDIQKAYARRWTILGTTEEWVYVVFLRLFACRPSPSFLVIVGRPAGEIPRGLLTFNTEFLER
jgi:hypothetical protein